jgi:hypothetical protein
MIIIKDRHIPKQYLTGFLSRLSFSFLSIILMFNPFLRVHSLAQIQTSPSIDSKTNEKELKQLINSNHAVLHTFAKKYLKLRKEPLSTRLTNLKRIALPLEKTAEILETFLKANPIINSEEARSQLDTLRAYSEFASKDVNERSILLSEEVTNRARIVRKEEPPPVFGVDGRMVLLSVLGADSTVNHIIVAHSLRNDLDERAIEAARSIKFIPASKDGHYVSQLVEIEYRFTTTAG